MIYHLTHDDLDGVGCAVIRQHFLPEMPAVEIECQPNEVDKKVASILNIFRPERDSLLITDLSPQDPEIIQRLDELHKVKPSIPCSKLDKTISNVLVVDHHKTAAERLKGYTWAIIGSGVSATELLFEVLRTNMNAAGIEGPSNAHLIEKFAEVVTDYDLYRLKDPRSEKLNYLLDGMGRDWFIGRFVEHPGPTLGPSSEAIVSALKRLEEKEVKEAVETASILRDEDGHQYAFAVATSNISKIGAALMEKYGNDIEYAEIANLRRGTVSLRSREGGYDCAKRAESFGGGGHQPAAGYSCDFRLTIRTGGKDAPSEQRDFALR